MKVITPEIKRKLKKILAPDKDSDVEPLDIEKLMRIMSLKDNIL